MCRRIPQEFIIIYIYLIATSRSSWSSSAEISEICAFSFSLSISRYSVWLVIKFTYISFVHVHSLVGWLGAFGGESGGSRTVYGAFHNCLAQLTYSGLRYSLHVECICFTLPNRTTGTVIHKPHICKQRRIHTSTLPEWKTSIFTGASSSQASHTCFSSEPTPNVPYLNTAHINQPFGWYVDASHMLFNCALCAPRAGICFIEENYTFLCGDGVSCRPHQLKLMHNSLRRRTTIRLHKHEKVRLCFRSNRITVRDTGECVQVFSM